MGQPRSEKIMFAGLCALAMALIGLLSYRHCSVTARWISIRYENGEVVSVTKHSKAGPRMIWKSHLPDDYRSEDQKTFVGHVRLSYESDSDWASYLEYDKKTADIGFREWLKKTNSRDPVNAYFMQNMPNLGQ